MTGRIAPLAFSTLGCPAWDAETVLERAAHYGYDAVEWRGGSDGTVRTDWPAERRSWLRAATAAAGLGSVAVTSYPELISGSAAVRERSIADIVAHVELARDIGADAVRVFLGVRDDDEPDSELRERAIAGLSAALPVARDAGVRLAIEPHDDHVAAGSVTPILDALPDPALGVVWDIGNAWSIGEDPEVGLEAYDGRIVWLQVKDGVGRGESWRLTDIGAGDVPIERALGLLVGRGQATTSEPLPAISVEWEKAWHPELAEPDVALPAARAWLDERLTRIATREGVATQPGGNE